MHRKFLYDSIGEKNFGNRSTFAKFKHTSYVVDIRVLK